MVACMPGTKTKTKTAQSNKEYETNEPENQRI